MGIQCLVLERDLDDKAAGTVIKVDDEVADCLKDAGIAREAEQDDVADKDEAADNEEQPAPDEDKEEGDDVEEMSLRKLAHNAKETVTKATEEAVRKLTNKINRPTVGKPKPSLFDQNRRIAGSDEWETGGFKNLGEASLAFIRSQKGGYEESRRMKRWGDLVKQKTSQSYMNISAGTHQGSDLVPQQWAKDLWRLAYANVVDLMGMCKKYEMEYQTLNIPSWVQPSGATAIQANVIAEGQAITTTEGITANVQLVLNKGTVLVSATDELLRFNAYALQNVIESVAPERLRYLTNGDVISGTNNGLNLLNNAVTITQIAETPGQIQYNDVLGMYSKLFDTFVNGACWLINQSTVAQLYALSFPNASATTQFPAFTPGVFGQDSILGVAPIGHLLGLPVYRVENVPSVGSRGALILAHMPSMAAGYTGMFADYTPYLYFNLAIDTFRFLFYYDTVNPMTQVYTREFGGTASNIVVLSAGSTSSS